MAGRSHARHTAAPAPSTAAPTPQRSKDAQDLQGNAAIAAELGKPTPEEMQSYLGAHVLEHLDADGMTFTEGDVVLPPDHWLKDRRYEYTFTCIGPSASDAIDAVYDAGTALECNLAAQLAAFASVRDALGKRKFDRRYPREAPLVLSSEIPVAIDDLTTEERVSDEGLVPGDLGYVRNHWAYLVRHPAGAWAGENAVYEGAGWWRGHGVSGRFTEASLAPSLANAYNASPDAADSAHWDDMAETYARDLGIDADALRPVIDTHVQRSAVPSSIGPGDVPGLELGASERARVELEKDRLALHRDLVQAAGQWSEGLEGRYGSMQAEKDREQAEADTIAAGTRGVRRLDAEKVVGLGGRLR